MDTKKNKTAFVLLFSLIIALLGFGLISACNLQLTKSVDKETIHPGETLTFTLIYENIGDSNCTGGGVKIEEVLDENLFYNGNYNVDLLNDLDDDGVYYGWQEIPGFDETTNTITWNANVVSPGEKGTITVEVEVVDKDGCEDYQIDNFFRAWSDQEDWKESNTINVLVDEECYSPACGNNILDSGEECEDGNLVNDDGCSSTCTIEEEDCECPPVPECECGGCYNNCNTCENNHECNPCGNGSVNPPVDDNDDECNNKECDKDNELEDIQQFCETNWVCSGWSECANGLMIRECIDKNNCEDEYGKPYEQTSCNEKVLSPAYVLEDETTGKISVGVIIGIITAILLLIILIILVG